MSEIIGYVPSRTLNGLADIGEERIRQVRKWGNQVHPDGTGRPHDRALADAARAYADALTANGRLTWRAILDEEVAEAYAEERGSALRAELIQVAAVALAWVEDLDREAAEDVDRAESELIDDDPTGEHEDPDQHFRHRVGGYSGSKPAAEIGPPRGEREGGMWEDQLDTTWIVDSSELY